MQRSILQYISYPLKGYRVPVAPSKAVQSAYCTVKRDSERRTKGRRCLRGEGNRKSKAINGTSPSNKFRIVIEKGRKRKKNDFILRSLLWASADRRYQRERYQKHRDTPPVRRDPAV